MDQTVTFRIHNTTVRETDLADRGVKERYLVELVEQLVARGTELPGWWWRDNGWLFAERVREYPTVVLPVVRVEDESEADNSGQLDQADEDTEPSTAMREGRRWLAWQQRKPDEGPAMSWLGWPGELAL